MDTWALIYNRASGSFRTRDLEAVCRALHGAGVRTRLLATDHAGHATELARSVDGVARVAAFGGDGTLNEVANGLLGREVPLAFLPGGTANVMAYELGLPLDPVAAALTALRGRPRAVWPGRVDERAFLLMAGFGFDGATVYHAPAWLKYLLGKPAYVWGGVRALLHRQPMARVRNGPTREHRAAWTVVARAKHYGGSFVVHPRAGLRREALGLVAVPPGGLLRFMLGMLALERPALARGTVFEEGMHFTLESEAPLHAQVDGEYHRSGTAFAFGLAEAPVSICFPYG